MQTSMEVKRMKEMLRNLYYQSVTQDQEGEVSFSEALQQFDVVVEIYEEESEQAKRENSELKLGLADMQRGLEQSIAKFHTIVSMTEDSTRMQDLDVAWIAREGQACCIAHMNEEGLAVVEEMPLEAENDMVEVETAMLHEAEDDMTHADRLRATNLFNRKAIDYIMDFDISSPFEDTRYHPLSAGPEPDDEEWIREDIPF